MSEAKLTNQQALKLVVEYLDRTTKYLRRRRRKIAAPTSEEMRSEIEGLERENRSLRSDVRYLSRQIVAKDRQITKNLSLLDDYRYRIGLLKEESES